MSVCINDTIWYLHTVGTWCIIFFYYDADDEEEDDDGKAEWVLTGGIIAGNGELKRKHGRGNY